MKKTFLTTCMAFLFLAATAQENPYIVKTRGAKKKAQTQMEGGQLGMQEEDEAARDFISQNFRFYSLCDWEEGMKFMVLPEKYDLVVKTFTDVATGKDVSSMPLKHKIMIYKGHSESLDGHSRINFFCPDNNKEYYYEIPNGSFEDYCYGKLGVPTLAYLGDVDIAREKLMGKTLYTKTQHFFVDTEVDGDGFQEVTVDKDMEVKVTAVGVGTRSFPVKIIVEDKNGNEFFQNVAISKTNSGMRDDEFIMDNTKHLFGNSFELVDDIMAVNSYNYKAFVGRVIHTKFPTKMLNETTKKTQNIPRLTGYQIESITPHKADTKFTVKLKSTILGTYFYKDVTLDRKGLAGSSDDFVEEPDDYFSYLFAPGPGKNVQTTETSRSMIRVGHVGIGFSEDETMLAAGEPDKVEHFDNGQYRWIYNRSNNKQLHVDFDGSGAVFKTTTKDLPVAKKVTGNKRKVVRRK
ncbi:hypothetical protein [Prevotella sp. lc2012]|uniref:hypothetical protein n=1 Tax=Prevotella sp. lc2012 TaxID=1761886 RepID=UPI00089776E6|nr:hypothetical protein [Prevotella sp. lc2012]SEE44684.1 hypothetical protein SAMN04487828_1695 [Prevotella sp. lc2012]